MLFAIGGEVVVVDGYEVRSAKNRVDD